MSRIKIADLDQSQLEVLSDRETMAIIGGSKQGNTINFSINISPIFQINSNINVQIAINGDNFNLANLSNNVE